MNLFGLTTETSEDGERIVRASGCVADHRDPEQRKAWITFQLEVDVPTIRNGAALRREILRKVCEQLEPLQTRFQHIADQSRS